jgi:hypothetical protein
MTHLPRTLVVGLVLSVLSTAVTSAEIAWTDIRTLGVEGRGFEKTKSYFDRLPASAEKLVRPPVWSLSHDSAGICVRFVSSATTLHARWTLRRTRLALPHMAATGVSGVDLYVRDGKGRWRWLACGFPTRTPTNSVRLVTGIPAGSREYMLYLPLYNGVTSVELGVPEGKTIDKAPSRPKSHARPILFYGTSITHGACASRPGMTHPAMLGRRYDRPVINLGFSGNGRMEIELAELLSQIEPAVYVLDCLPNMRAAEVTERVGPFVRRLRKTRPETPILLVEDRSYADSFLVTSKRERNESSRKALAMEYQKLQRDGVAGLHYLRGADLLGDDGEGTVDSSHPNDLGFMRQAAAFAKVLGPLLESK